jgi:trk system potassium uptake protein TrkA
VTTIAKEGELMRVVIVGCGRVGAHLARSLVKKGCQVSVIDRNSSAFVRLGGDFPGSLVLGTGIDEDVLRKAGIEQTDVLIAVTNGDNTNIMAAQVAKEIFGVPRAICRIYDPLREEIYRDLGLETTCPTILGATRIEEILGN